MLKVNIVAIGRDKDRWVSAGAAHFEKLLQRWCRVEWTVLRPPARSGALSPQEIRRSEAELIRGALGQQYTVALADSGRGFTSEEFARYLEKLQTSSAGHVNFVIGGPYGLDESILDAANECISLSPLTLSHQIVRLVFLEQLYRGFSILHGTDYHK